MSKYKGVFWVLFFFFLGKPTCLGPKNVSMFSQRRKQILFLTRPSERLCGSQQLRLALVLEPLLSSPVGSPRISLQTKST